MDVATGTERLLVPGTAFTFAPRFSPDGREILFSMAAAATPTSTSSAPTAAARGG